MVFILDTDHVSALLRGNSQVQAIIDRTSTPVCTSIVTVQEVFNGWVVKINNAKPNDDLVELYEEFRRSVNYLKKLDILGFDATADRQLHQLLQTNPPLRKARLQRDMRIASIALSRNATVVTRNRRDFEQVPGLRVENWIG